MIEVKQTTEGQVVKQDTPQMITTTMIVNDLENGIDRPGIQEKYNLEAWEVKQMFMHPALKGKKAKKVRKLSFDFIDDVNPDVLPGQIDIEDAIEEEENTSMKDAAIDEMNGRQEMDAQDQANEMEEDDDNTEY